MQNALQDLVHRFIDLHDLLTSPEHRTAWLYLLSGALIALVAYRRDHARVTRSLRGFLAWLLPARIYRHRSFGVDVGVVVFNHLFGPARWVFEGYTIVTLASAVQATLADLLGSTPAEPGLGASIGCGVVIFLAKDFSLFFSHYLHHKVPLLWEFHRVHHSAEHLNPLTTYRIHPVEEVLEGIVILAITGTTMGLLGLCFDLGFLNKGYLFVNIWVFVRLFNLLGANLRHSHVWLTLPGWLGQVFSSPAQHQIHHSIDPVHYGKNMGFFLNVWDRAFGTLYIPTRHERITFGVIDGVTHVNPVHALLQPFQGAADVLMGRPPQGANESR